MAAPTAHLPWFLRDARWPRAALAAVPVVLVNVVAFYGQLAYWYAALVTVMAVLVAGTLESIAIYVAWQAHLAQLANDSALRLRFAAYAIAAVIGALNYSHWCATGWRPTPAAVAFALCSVLSPWLWGIHTRRVSRDELMKAGLIEPHALRLGMTRWAWHPVRSARVMYAATWKGETDPATAVAAWTPRKKKASAKASVSRPSWKPSTPAQIMREEGVRFSTAKTIARRVDAAVKASQNGHGGQS